MKYCTKCGTQLADEAEFCSACGAKQNPSAEATSENVTYEKVSGEIVTDSSMEQGAAQADNGDTVQKIKEFFTTMFTKIATWIVKYCQIFAILVLLINLWQVIGGFRRIMVGGKFHFAILLASVLGLLYVAAEGMFGLKGSNAVKENYSEESPFLIKEHLAPIALFCISNLVFAGKSLRMGVFFTALILLVAGFAVSFYQKNGKGMDSGKIIDAITEELAVGISAALMVDILIIVFGLLAGIAMWLVGLALVILFLPLIIRLIIFCIWVS